MDLTLSLSLSLFLSMCGYSETTYQDSTILTLFLFYTQSSISHPIQSTQNSPSIIFKILFLPSFLQILTGANRRATNLHVTATPRIHPLPYPALHIPKPIAPVQHSTTYPHPSISAVNHSLPPPIYIYPPSLHFPSVPRLGKSARHALSVRLYNKGIKTGRQGS
ncbi:unnamed protein product [Periconia digitata]|uniref:Uncharacterized protein n=1 Tax=Periconia digitata TaxID=1303443 RepID=A0A9W4U2G0_9PLEO|nr:unnamed protein product [Periconia digitata]